jgi:predicted RNase H-like HicB family nuclease
VGYKLTAVVTREGKFHVAECVELGVASQGESFEEALANLREAVHLYLKDEDKAALNLPTTAPIVTTIEV